MLGLFLAWTPLAHALLDITENSELVSPEYSKTISMDFKSAALNDVLKIFSQQSGLNFIAATDVANKTINLYLDKVPVEEALERILSANNLTYELNDDSNIFLVKELKRPSKELMTRIYPLKFATVPSSKMNSTFSGSSDSGSSSGSESSDSGESSSSGSGSSGSSGGSSGSSSDSGSSGGSSSGGIVAVIENVITEDGKVIEDSRTNSIIVTDIPMNFPMIEQTIARLDIRIPQILIEVEMLDISKNTADLLGAKFGDSDSFSPVEFKGGASKTSLFPFNQDNAVDDGKSSGSTYTPGTLSFAGLKFTLDFLRTQSDTKNLARPRILTLDNQTAQINVSTDEAISITKSDTTSASGSTTSGNTPERAKTGVFLDVTPQTNLYTREITMAIQPKVILAKQSAFQDFKDTEERKTKSILRVKDGDTIVIGGLLRTDVSDSRTRVPFFGEVPIIGAAFRHKDKTENQRELVIFITPHILKEDGESKLSSADKKAFIREQNFPSKKLKEIDKDLTLFEKRR